MSPRNLFTYEMRRTSAIKLNIERKTLRTNLTSKFRAVQNHIYASRRLFTHASSLTPRSVRRRVRSSCCADCRSRPQSIRDRLWSRSVANSDTGRPRTASCVAAMTESAAVAEVDGSSTATHESIGVTESVGAAHGDLSDSNSATGRAMARRVGPVSCPNNLMCAFAYLLVGMARPHGRTGRDP